jgi:hypothetical protein
VCVIRWRTTACAVSTASKVGYSTGAASVPIALVKPNARHSGAVTSTRASGASCPKPRATLTGVVGLAVYLTLGREIDWRLTLPLMAGALRRCRSPP